MTYRLTFKQMHNEGGKGARGERGRNYPAAESLRGRRINTGGHRKVLTMSQALYSTADLLPKDLRFNMGAPNLFLAPGAI